MTKRGVWILGSGKRVREAALPALARSEDAFELRGIFARTEKTIEAEGRSYPVQPLDSWQRDAITEGDLVFMAVAKGAVPAVLRRIHALAPPAIDLLIDTPVLLYKHMGALSLLSGFRNVWVAEDCITLPCWDPVHAAREAGRLGELRSVELVNSAYAYHGFAMAKAVLGLGPVRSARRTRGSERRRSVRLENGLGFEVVEPRDYTRGRIRVIGSAATVSDEATREGVLPWRVMADGGVCTGFRVDDIECSLDGEERSLVGAPLVEDWENAGVTAWMEGQKRVGFLRFLRTIAKGGGAYPLSEALDDTAVDYHLERLGFYRSNPLTSPRYAPARMLLKGLTRLTGA